MDLHVWMAFPQPNGGSNIFRVTGGRTQGPLRPPPEQGMRALSVLASPAQADFQKNRRIV